MSGPLEKIPGTGWSQLAVDPNHVRSLVMVDDATYANTDWLELVVAEAHRKGDRACRYRDCAQTAAYAFFLRPKDFGGIVCAEHMALVHAERDLGQQVDATIYQPRDGGSL